MERYDGYSRLVASLRSALPNDWTFMISWFETLDLHKRKAGITLFRARSLPLYDNSTYDVKVQPFLRSFVRHVGSEREAIRIVDEVISQPDSSAVMLSFLLSAPYDDQTITEIFQTMVIKELSVLESTPNESSVQWHHLYTTDQTLHRDFRSSPYTNDAFRRIIGRWTNYLQNHVVYPFSSTRTLSKATTREYNRLSGNELDDVCPLQLEQYYAQTGNVVESPCEMRQVWYPTQATPRTYYAMGGTAYFRSRYLRDIFNVLSDMLPSTNRYTRVQPSHLTFGENEDVFVYDLTSFTSLFHEQRYFLNFVARIVDGLEIVVFDTHVGFRKVLISDLIIEYNELNQEPEYSMERIWNVDLVLHHSVAGFLGVYANLITCTVPHGICLMSLRNEALKSWCAGDDGGSLGRKNDTNHLHDLDLMSNTIGINQKDKVYHGNDVLVALKRKLIRLPLSLHLQENVLFPPFSVFFKNDSRFRNNHKEDSDPEDAVATFCSGLMSMMYQMSQCSFDGSDVSFLKDFLPVIYRQLSLPPEGFFPPLCGHVARHQKRSLSFTVPRIIGDFWSDDPNLALINAYMPSYFLGTLQEDLKWDGSIRDEWLSNGDKLLSMGVRMGYLEREEVRVTYTQYDDVKAAVYREFLKDHNRASVVYQYRLIDDIPVYYSVE